MPIDNPDRLHHSQTTFVARHAIVEVLEEYEDDASVTLRELTRRGLSNEELIDRGIEWDILEGYRLALIDLKAAQDTMEEHAAFNYLVDKMQLEYPSAPRTQLQKSARSLVAVPETRRELVAEMGLYEKLGITL